MNDLYKETCELFDNVIAQNKKVKAEYLNDGLNECYTPKEFISQFGVVNINFGRQVGKTEYIKARATENDLVIIHDTESHTVEEQYKGCKAKVVTASELWEAMVRGTFAIWAQDEEPETIWIDEPAYVITYMDFNYLQAKLIKRYTQSIIMVGQHIGGESSIPNKHQ